MPESETSRTSVLRDAGMLIGAPLKGDPRHVEARPGEPVAIQHGIRSPFAMPPLVGVAAGANMAKGPRSAENAGLVSRINGRHPNELRLLLQGLLHRARIDAPTPRFKTMPANTGKSGKSWRAR